MHIHISVQSVDEAHSWTTTERLSEISYFTTLCQTPRFELSLLLTSPHTTSVSTECVTGFILTFELVREEKNGKKYCASKAEH